MKEIITLLRPRILSVKNRSFSGKDKRWLGKFLFFAVIGLIFWGGIFAISLRILEYFKSIAELGDILSLKLLSMMLLTFLSLLVFSSVLTSLSKLYLSRDLPLVHSMPVSSYKIIITRWIESTIDSSWMVIVYTLPVFISYGIVSDASPLFYVNILSILFSLSIIASGISTFLVLIAVFMVPASRIRSIFIFIGLGFFIVLFFAFRLLRPERLVDPEVFATALFYLKSLKTPAPPYLPSTWAFDGMKAILSDQFVEGLFHTGLLWSCAGFMVLLIIIVADRIYFAGLSKAQSTHRRVFRYDIFNRRFFNFLSRPVKALAEKEVKIFFRDQTQWTQLFLIGALVVIYIYNFSALPLERAPIQTIYLQNLLSFLNMGLAGFVLTAVTARFVYPAISSEGGAFWLLISGPIPLKHYLWIKFFIYFFPLLGLTELLIVATNIMLKVTPFMMVLSTITVLFIVPGIVSLGIGFGAAHPDFKSENPAQTVTSFGGLIFMMFCAGYIGLVIILEAGPVYYIFMAQIKEQAIDVFGWIWIIGSLALVFLLNILAVVLPMSFGAKKLHLSF